MRRVFHLTHTVRYDECNCDGVLTPAAFLRYMQDIAARDAEDAHLEGNGFWVVKRTVISFNVPVPVHTALELSTFGIGFTRITAQRGYEARYVGASSDAEPLISARTLWVYLDTHGRPTRLPERTGDIWLPDGPQPQHPETSFPTFPESMPRTTTSTVHFSDIDEMRHLNNASSVEMLDDAAWDAHTSEQITPDTTRFDMLHYDIDYVDSPRFGDKLDIASWITPQAESNEQELERLQQVTRNGKVMIRAYSRWSKHTLA